MNTAVSAPAREFEVTAPSRNAYLTLASLLALLPLLAVFLSAKPSTESWRHVAILLQLLLGIVGLLLWVMQRRSVQFASGMLTIKAGPYTRHVACSELDLAHSRVASLDERIELRPMLRTNGIGLPGFAVGHHRLRDRSKAFVLLTDRRRVLALRERNGRALLLSVARPQALLDALRGLAAG